AAVLRATVAPFAEATVRFPYVFFAALRALAARLAPGGVAIVSDFGSMEARDLAGDQDRMPVFYGNTLNHDVSFPLLAELASQEGLGFAHTASLGALHTAALSRGGPARSFR